MKKRIKKRIKKHPHEIAVIIAIVVAIQLVGLLMSDKGYFFSPTIDALLGVIELFGFGVWIGIFIGKNKKTH